MFAETLFGELTRERQKSTPESIKFDLDSFKDKGYLTHNFHPYPAKFVPQIPRIIIEALTDVGDTVLDPFCGSGTSLVEASILQRHSVGFDLNPIAGLISRVKTTVLSEAQLGEVLSVLHNLDRMLLPISRGDYGSFDVDIPEFLNRDHWFQPFVQQELGIIREMIWEVTDEKARNFLKVTLSAIVVKVSNQDSDTRWVAVQKSIRNGDVVKAFLTKARNMLKRIREYGRLHPLPTQIHIEPLTDGGELILEKSIDLIITSPPYLNSFDYYLYHKLRFFWLGLDHYPVQARELGSRHRHSDKNEGIETYTSGIRANIESMLRIIKPQAYLCMVIGDSLLKGQLVRMNEIYERICTGLGLIHVHTHSYNQRKYTTSFTRNLRTAFKQTHIMFFQRP
jgi:DNA modification methylase